MTDIAVGEAGSQEAGDKIMNHLRYGTTIAGLVINESGKVPQPGEQLTFRGLELEVLEADERRIGRLRVRRALGENSNGTSQTP